MNAKVHQFPPAQARAKSSFRAPAVLSTARIAVLDDYHLRLEGLVLVYGRKRVELTKLGAGELAAVMYWAGTAASPGHNPHGKCDVSGLCVRGSAAPRNGSFGLVEITGMGRPLKPGEATSLIRRLCKLSDGGTGRMLGV